MKKICLTLFIVSAIIISVSFMSDNSSCGVDQWMARRLGGSAKVNLPVGEELMMVTYKHNSLWYLTKMREERRPPKCYKFRESSTFGVFEGEVEICEQ